MASHKLPRDENWSGSCRWGPYLLAPITLGVLISWALAGVQLHLDQHPEPNVIGIDPLSAADIAVPIWLLAVETIHLPIHIMLYLRVLPRSRLHPAIAMALALTFIVLWTGYTISNFVFYFSQDLFGTQYPVVIVRGVVSIFVAIFYCVYMKFATDAYQRLQRGKAVGVMPESDSNATSTSGDAAVQYESHRPKATV